MSKFFCTTADPSQTLKTFHLDDLAPYKLEKQFDEHDGRDMRVFFAGRDDLHGVLAHLLSRCSRSFFFNMFAYADDELDQLVRNLIDDKNVYVQGTIDDTEAQTDHEKAIIAGWSDKVRASFAIGASPTGAYTHTKGGVLDGKAAFDGSTNWSASAEGVHVPGKRYYAQNNTLIVYTAHAPIAEFTAELAEEHAAALKQLHLAA